jgi:hypothetical protein
MNKLGDIWQQQQQQPQNKFQPRNSFKSPVQYKLSEYYSQNLSRQQRIGSNFDDSETNTYLMSPNRQTAQNYFFPNQQQQQQDYTNKQNNILWSGRLLPKLYPENAIYSRKVFIGGVPWDCDQQSLVNALHRYGPVKSEIPGKDQKHPRVPTNNKNNDRVAPGYIYVIFDHESAVQKMLADCRKETKNGGEHYYYTIFIPPTNNGLNLGNKRGKAKEVEVIPWNQDDTSYVPEKNPNLLPSKIDSKSTIFVGALHGMLNAQGLAKVMNELYGEVIHAGLDTDKYKYPIGSGRVTFRNKKSYVDAIKSKYVAIKANPSEGDPSPKFEKTVS